MTQGNVCKVESHSSQGKERSEQGQRRPKKEQIAEILAHKRSVIWVSYRVWIPDPVKSNGI